MPKFERFIHNLNIAVDGVLQNKFRSLLTALGIIFGVAAVIAMLAIGSGARHEILEQMKMVGVNNIIVRPVFFDENDEVLRGKYSPGLTLEDAQGLKDIIPTMRQISPETTMNMYAMKKGIRNSVRVSGVTPGFFDVFNLDLWQGKMFTEDQLKNGETVAIIGSNIRSVFFGNENPIGQQIKCGNVWLTVVGVAEDRAVSGDNTDDLGISEFNNVIYIPVRTLLIRYEDRSAISAAQIKRANAPSGRRGNQNSEDDKSGNYNQLDRIVIQVEDSEQLAATADIVKRFLKRRHNDVEDFEVIIPELLLQQEQRTKDIFNIVLGAIAGISLLIGGIGIMNIMLASVVERTREIGVRLAVGAKKSDVVLQFLSESTLISLSGGIAGIFLGLFISRAIMQVAGILTIVTLSSVIISFGVAAMVGILFGFMPARKAAHKDPVESLRHE